MFQHAFTVNNDTAELARVRQEVLRAIGESDFPMEAGQRMTVAVDEAVTNIIEHSYADHETGSAPIHLRLTCDERSFRIDICDQGHSFPVDRSPRVDIDMHVAAGKDGGLGLFLINRIMDVVEYSPQIGTGNHLILIKYRREEDLGERGIHKSEALTVCDDTVHLQKVRNVVDAALRNSDFSARAINRLQVAVDEALTYVINNAYQGSGEGHIDLRLFIDDHCFRIEMHDDGIAVDFQQILDKDLRRRIEENDLNGLGVILMHRIMDVVDYREDHGGNHLVLIKYR